MIYLIDTASTEVVGATLDVARGITDFGMLAITGAFFLVLTGLMWVAVFRWFKALIDRLVDEYGQKMDMQLRAMNRLSDTMDDIAEQLAPETLIRVKNYTGAHFDLSTEKVCRLIKRIREENHIADREATKTKIYTLIKNLHDDRNSRFDAFSYRGLRLSAYCSPEWVQWVCDVVEREIYSDKVSHARARTNVEAVYERIKIDFYLRMGKE